MKTGLPEKTPAVSENLRSPEKVMRLSSSDKAKGASA